MVTSAGQSLDVAIQGEQRKMMGWMILAALGLAGFAVLFVILTDGRYLGKRLMHWIYDRLGPAMFGARSEAERWRSLIEALQLRGDEEVLDVGSATGDLPLTIAAMPGFSGRVSGIDWSPRMVALAQAEADRRGLSSIARFQVADARQPLPFDRCEFEVVSCLGLLETLPHPERLLSELVRVLKPAGVLVLSLYRGWAAWSVALSRDWYQQHLAVWGLRDLRLVSRGRNEDVLIAQCPAIEGAKDEIET